MPRDRFDATDAGGGGTFAGNQEESDVASVPDMGAAAQFVGKWLISADGDGAHFGAVLLAEERHGAFLLGLVERFLLDMQFIIIQHPMVDGLLDLRQYILGKCLGMGEVET